MKKAREVIADQLFWSYEGSYFNPQAMADDYAALVVKKLSEAGFVILPREPDEGMIEAACRALCRLNGEEPDEDFRTQDGVMLLVAVEDGKQHRWRLHAHKVKASYRAMVQHYESKGEAE